MLEAAPNTREAWGIDAGLALGISLGGADRARDWSSNLDWVDYAEKRGLHSIWMPEMHFVPGGNAAPLLPLAAFAARTSRIRLATTSLLLPIHEPVALAHEIAALDHLSGGRLIVGLGRGFGPGLFRAFGVEGKTKRDRFDRALDAMFDCWRNDGGTGATTRQSPHPNLAVAAFGPKGLAQSARRGLPYLASPMESIQQIADNLAQHRAQLADSVGDRRVVVPVLRTVFVSSNAKSLDRVREKLEGERRIRSAALPKSMARAMAAPLDDRAVIGRPAEVRDRLMRYRDELGMDLLVARPVVAGASRDEQRESLEAIVDLVPGL